MSTTTTTTLNALEALGKYYKTQYSNASTLAESGEVNGALKIMRKLHVDPALDLFTRAKVNYFLAVYEDEDNVRYMLRCLEMVHVYCDSGRVETEDVTELEVLALRFLECYYRFLAEEEEEAKGSGEGEEDEVGMLSDVDEMEEDEGRMSVGEMETVPEEEHEEDIVGIVSDADDEESSKLVEALYAGLYPRKLRWYETQDNTFKVLQSQTTL